MLEQPDYPTELIGKTTRRFRQLGLGYTNLGALLMALGLAYDSPLGREWAAALTSLMSGRAYATCESLPTNGAVRRLRRNREPMLRVLGMHRMQIPHCVANPADKLCQRLLQRGQRPLSLERTSAFEIPRYRFLHRPALSVS